MAHTTERELCYISGCPFKPSTLYYIIILQGVSSLHSLTPYTKDDCAVGHVAARPGRLKHYRARAHPDMTEHVTRSISYLYPNSVAASLTRAPKRRRLEQNRLPS